jgi:hypothetical protein
VGVGSGVGSGISKPFEQPDNTNPIIAKVNNFFISVKYLIDYIAIYFAKLRIFLINKKKTPINPPGVQIN